MVADPLVSENRSKAAQAARLRIALQLSDDGVEMKRCSLKRRYPNCSEDEIQGELKAWLGSSEPADYVEGWTVLNPSRFAK